VYFGVPVLSIANYRNCYGEKNFHRKVKFLPLTVNPPSAYQQVSSNSSRTRKNRRARPKRPVFVYIKVDTLEDFSPLKSKSKFWDSFEKR
jgi:hypothetical protein